MDLARLEAQVAELRRRTLAAADDVAVERGTRHAAAWLAHVVRAEPARVRADAGLAATMDGRYAATTRALASGSVNLDQARAIVAACDELPGRLGVDIRARAERDLIDLAADFGLAELRRLGRAILHVTAPDLADAEDARRLDQQERSAEESATLRFRPTGEGTTRLSMLLPDAAAARLATYLDAYTNPRVSSSPEVSGLAGADTSTTGEATTTAGHNPDPERLPRHRCLARAFCRLLEHLDPHGLPEQGGDATTVVITRPPTSCSPNSAPPS